ncbi:MAG: OmpL47-type beta-barrel domain-containing protein, partial [Candidatus Thorarchaeota archaeon]
MSDGNWYLHVIAVNPDGAYNAGGTVHLGPFKIDTVKPKTRANPPKGWQTADFNVQLYCSDGYITKNLVSYWKLNESSGTTAVDSQGGYNGTLSNFPVDDSQWKQGMIQNALDFDGTDDYVSVADNAALDFDATESFTIDLWVKLDSNGSEQVLFAKKVSSSGDCSGTVTACSSLSSESTCSTQLGCSWDPADCYGTCTDCTSMSDSSSCSNQLGCSWDPADCYGSPTACTSFSSESTCINQSGCSWDPADCYGTCTSCSSFANGTSCSNQLGCSWDSANCYGAATPCSNYSDSSSCTAQDGCNWDTANCYGTPHSCTYWSNPYDCEDFGCDWDEENCYGTCTSCSNCDTESCCNGISGCSWVSGSGSCSGTPPSDTACSYFLQDDCEVMCGCYWNGSICKASYSSCSGLSESLCDCTAGCTWSGSSAYCDGTCTSCSSIGSESTCEDQPGCSWDPENCYGTPYSCDYWTTYSGGSEARCTADGCTWDEANCWGVVTSCSSINDQSSCLDQDGCSWDSEGPCSGTCTSCSSISDESTCSSQSGCSWDPADCYGSPTACTSFGTENDCSNQSGCSWDPADCYGTCTECTSISDESTCSSQSGCSWDPAGPCSGTATTCSSISTQSTCETQAGCVWSGAGTGYSLKVSSSNYLVLYLNDGTDSATITSNSVITSGKWHHVSAVFDRSAGKVRLYIDANLVKEQAVSNIDDLSNSVALLFGQSSDNTSRFNGLLDDVKLYDAALTSFQVEKNYASDGNIYASGCYDTQHRIDYSAWIDSNLVQISTDGNKQVDYNSTDVAGNIEAINSFWAALDKLSPSTSVSVDCAWRDSNLAITLVPSDAGSGIANTHYCIDDLNSCIPNTNGTSLTVGCNFGSVCKKYVRYYSTDVAGHEESINATCQIKIDKQAPIVSDDTAVSWFGADQVITLTCNDANGSGCSTTKYCLYNDGASACDPSTGSTGTSVSVSCPANSVVQKRIAYISFDNVDNNSGSITSTNAVKIDKQAPSTTNDAPSGWHTSNFSFSLFCSDGNGSGCSTTAYRLDSGDWNANSTVWISTDGNHQVDYNSIDSVGNTESTKTVYAALDKTAPSTTDNAPTGWQTADFNVILSCNDATSGCSATYYDLNYAGWTSGNTVPIATDGNYRLDYNSVDVAGNIETMHSIWVALDKTVPSTTDDGNSAWQSSDQIVTLTPTDPVSGVDYTQYIVSSTSGSGTPSTTGTSVSVTCPVNGTCIKYVRYRSIDNAGNTETTKEVTIRIDKNAPFSYTNSIASCTSSDKNLFIYCSDGNGSGCSVSYYRLDSDASDSISYGSWQTYTGAILFNSDGNYAVESYSVDSVGNASQHNVKYIVVDKSPPTPNPATIASITADSNSQITVTATSASDSGCGLSATSYDFNVNGSWHGWQSSVSYTDSGLSANTRHCYTVRYRDAAGNISNESALSCAYTLPAVPVPVSSSHSVGEWSSDSTVDFTCSGAASSYYYVWDQLPNTTVTSADTVWDGSLLSKTALSDGNWYLHVIAVNPDGAYNA